VSAGADEAVPSGDVATSARPVVGLVYWNAKFDGKKGLVTPATVTVKVPV